MTRTLAVLVALGSVGCEVVRPCAALCCRTDQPPEQVGEVTVLRPPAATRRVAVPAAGQSLRSVLRAAGVYAAVPAADRWRYMAVVPQPEATYTLSLPLTESTAVGLIRLGPGQSVSVVDRGDTDLARGLKPGPLLPPPAATDPRGIARWIAGTAFWVKPAPAALAALDDPNTTPAGLLTVLFDQKLLSLSSDLDGERPAAATTSAEEYRRFFTGRLATAYRLKWEERANRVSWDLDWPAIRATYPGGKLPDEVQLTLVSAANATVSPLNDSTKVNPAPGETSNTYPRLGDIAKVLGGDSADAIVVRRVVGGRAAVFVLPRDPGKYEPDPPDLLDSLNRTARQNRLLVFSGDEVRVMSPAALPPVTAGLLRTTIP